MLKMTVKATIGSRTFSAIPPAPPAHPKRVAGLDLGFVQTKFVWGTRRPQYSDAGIMVDPGNTCKFGSLVKRRSEVATEGLEDAEGYVIVDEHGTWNVGSKGSYDFTSERLTRDSDLPKLYTALALFRQQTGSSIIDLLVSGLPVDEYSQYRGALQQALTGDFQFGFGSQQMQISVKKVAVIPQAAGAFYDYGLTDDGKLTDSPLLRETVLVFDIGGKTTDGCIMEKSKYSQDSFTIRQGIWKVHNELRKLIARHYRGFVLAPSEVDAVMRTGILNIGGTQEDVTHLRTKALETHFPAIRDELSVYVDDLRRFSAILVAGGGAALYTPYIQSITSVPVIQLSHAEYSNASGYRKYGMLLMGA